MSRTAVAPVPPEDIPVIRIIAMPADTNPDGDIFGGWLLATIGIYEVLLAFSTSLLALMGVAVNAAVIVMRVREPALARPWRMPLYPLPAITALVINATLFVVFVAEDPTTAAKAFGGLAVLVGLAWLLIRRKTTAS